MLDSVREICIENGKPMGNGLDLASFSLRTPLCGYHASLLDGVAKSQSPREDKENCLLLGWASNRTLGKSRTPSNNLAWGRHLEGRGSCVWL